MTEDKPNADPARVAWIAVSAAFQALGRVFFCLDPSFRLIHASASLDELAGTGAAHEAEGKPVEEILGPELFGLQGALRQALLMGERREGWRALLSAGGERRLVSVTVAPFCQPVEGVCDPRVAYVVVIRPAEKETLEPGGPVAFGALVARSTSMIRIFRLAENLEHSEATVLLTGESGTGKELVARAIHAHSPRKNGPFVAVNCAPRSRASSSKASSSDMCAEPSRGPCATVKGGSRWLPEARSFWTKSATWRCLSR
jgi:Sigma-54 interaction domain/PAS fold